MIQLLISCWKSHKNVFAFENTPSLKLDLSFWISQNHLLEYGMVVEACGISSNLISVICNFLTNQKRRVVVSGT